MTEQPMTHHQISLEIYEFLLDMHKESRFSKFEINKEKAISTIDSLIGNSFIYYDGECLFIGRKFQPWYSDEIHASDFIMYTKKSGRGKGLAKKAIIEFIEWAKNNGATSISIARSSGINEESFKNLSESLGLKRIGEIYNV